ncbi:sigma-70 family RNA polymerase sigma factor [Bacillus sp. KH172YL63]|uniref:sigma-70 family RNA polymerase sigma factor n=1 Tax=Bacillus sp. KH172YL63 TaxID=2709784 RepID=UPI001563E0E6|nr:sigma-70 family RNA polymerase sigma factor [Bacillus sp. KH172YL63]
MKQQGKYAKAEKDQLLEEAMREYGNDVYYIVFSYVKEHSLAEDLTQEIFIKFYQKMDTFREDSSLKTWIISVAVNHCKDYLRRWDTRMISISNKINDLVKGKMGAPEQSVLEKEQHSELIRNVLALPVKYREVIFLYYFEEMKLSEIGACMGLNTNTVKTRITRGKALLGTAIKRNEVYKNG